MDNRALSISHVPALRGIRGRAQARLAILETRVRVIAVVAAMTEMDRLRASRDALFMERSQRDISTNARIAELTGRLASTEQAISHFEASDPRSGEASHQLDVALAEKRGINEQLTGAIDARARELEELNDRIALLEVEHYDASQRTSRAMQELGVGSTDLHDLIAMTGHPEASSIIECASRPRRAARAAVLLEVMRAEASRAAAQLALVGSSEAYDRALQDLMDSEEAFARACHEREAATRNCDRALRVLLRANHDVAQVGANPHIVLRVADEASSKLRALSKEMDALHPADVNGSTPAGSGSGERQESPATQGTGSSPMTADGPVAAPRPDQSPDPSSPAQEVATS